MNNCLGKDIQELLKDVALANKRLTNPNMFYARNLVLYNMQLPHEQAMGKHHKHVESHIESIDSYTNLTKYNSDEIEKMYLDFKTF